MTAERLHVYVYREGKRKGMEGNGREDLQLGHPPKPRYVTREAGAFGISAFAC